jgi:glycosyltransferase involved in cell wall biosynthesis
MADPMARASVCVIAHSHPDFSKGGGEMAAHRQFAALRAAGRDATYVGGSEAGTAYAAQHAIELVMPHGEHEHVFAFQGMAEDRLAWDDAYQRRMLVRFLAGLASDVYHFHHYWRVGLDLIHELMLARPDARFVITLHEMLAICLHHGQMIKARSRELCRRESPLNCLACFPNETLERFAFRKATMLSVLRRFDHIVYPSDFIRGRYEAWGLAGQPASVIENYLGDELLQADRRPADANRVAHRFGFFGQPTPWKGLDILLRAMPLALRENPTITLTVFGADREDVLRLFPVLEPLIEAVGPNLSFAGRYDALDAVSLMRSVGWVVVPSIWWENSPVVIQEARRAGTPLIVAGIGGMAEKAWAGVDALHFDRASPVDLARAMLDAAKPDTRAMLGATVRDTIGRDEFIAALDAAFAPAEAARRAAAE